MNTVPGRRPAVHVIVRTVDRHASGLLTGLALLHRSGRIRFTQQMLPPPAPLTTGPWHLRDKDDSNIEIHVDDRASGFVDFHDSWEINDAGYDSHDVYFKRSLDLLKLSVDRRSKLEPLGFTYEVWSDRFDRWEALRLLGQTAPWHTRISRFSRMAAQSAATWLGVRPRPTVSSTSSAPRSDLTPRALFMVGLWDPAIVARHDPSRVAEFDAINAMRRDCVLQLRAAFGARFTGGTQHSAFATRYAPGALMPNPASATKGRYLTLVREHPICVATMGLHGSNGCKLAEYVALSRAVVSEPLRYAVPGAFEPGRNYLSFSKPEECVAQVGRLLEDHALRSRLMRENHDYYNRWMRPDTLAARVVDAIIERRR